MSLNEVKEKLKEAKVEWTVRKFENDKDYKKNKPFEISTFDGNIMLNEGINELWTILCSAGGTKYDNSNAYLGVGEDSTAAAATQTGLQGSSLTFKGMDAGYPTYGSSQKATWKATFGSSDANNAWNEFCIVNGNSNSAKLLNRKVSNQGTKASGQTWTITLAITLS